MLLGATSKKTKYFLRRHKDANDAIKTPKVKLPEKRNSETFGKL
jgi:hypothetical protein